MSEPSTIVSACHESQQQSLAGRLPPDMLDHIFSIHFAMKHPKSERTAKELSLVCQSWAGPAQRHLFQQLVLDEVNLEDDLDAIETSCGQHAKQLNVLSDEEGHWTIKSLNEALKKLPSITSLILNITWESLEVDADFSKLVQLPNLQELTLHSSRKSEDALIHYQHIISAAPKISTLTLDDYDGFKECLFPQANDATPIALPNLQHLHLLNGPTSGVFHATMLLSSATLSQIAELSLVTNFSGYSRRGGRGNYHSVSELLGVMATKIKTLTFPEPSSKHALDWFTLDACPNVETVTFNSPFQVPETVHSANCRATTVRFIRLDDDDREGWEECEWILEPLALLRKVKRVEIVNASVASSVKEKLQSLGIEVLVQDA